MLFLLHLLSLPLIFSVPYLFHLSLLPLYFIFFPSLSLHCPHFHTSLSLSPYFSYSPLQFFSLSLHCLQCSVSVISSSPGSSPFKFSVSSAVYLFLLSLFLLSLILSTTSSPSSGSHNSITFTRFHCIRLPLCRILLTTSLLIVLPCTLS